MLSFQIAVDYLFFQLGFFRYYICCSRNRVGFLPWVNLRRQFVHFIKLDTNTFLGKFHCQKERIAPIPIYFSLILFALQILQLHVLGWCSLTRLNQYFVINIRSRYYTYFACSISLFWKGMYRSKWVLLCSLYGLGLLLQILHLFL